jgi:hypothetical protein
MEIARVSLPIWLLFWVVSNKVEIDQNADRNKLLENINAIHNR